MMKFFFAILVCAFTCAAIGAGVIAFVAHELTQQTEYRP